LLIFATCPSHENEAWYRIALVIPGHYWFRFNLYVNAVWRIACVVMLTLTTNLRSNLRFLLVHFAGPYLKPNANSEWQKASGCLSASVPTELDGGTGTRCSHWDEVCLGTEIMTGWLNTTNPLSNITIGGLQDLGYAVSYSTAEPYTPPNCRCNRRLRQRDLQSGGPPKPSPKAKKNAHMYGEDLLKKRKKDKEQFPKRKDLTFIGHLFVTVYYCCDENDVDCKDICSLDVTADEDND
jgi:hypothetical protein